MAHWLWAFEVIKPNKAQDFHPEPIIKEARLLCALCCCGLLFSGGFGFGGSFGLGNGFCLGHDLQRLFGHDEPHHDVDPETGPTEHQAQYEQQTEQRGVYGEEFAQAAGYASEHAVVAGAV